MRLFIIHRYVCVCVIFCYAIVCFSFSVARVALVTTAWVAEFSVFVVFVFLFGIFDFVRLRDYFNSLNHDNRNFEIHTATVAAMSTTLLLLYICMFVSCQVLKQQFHLHKHVLSSILFVNIFYATISKLSTSLSIFCFWFCLCLRLFFKIFFYYLKHL